MDIVIDTRGDSGLTNRNRLIDSDDDDDMEIKIIDVDSTRIYDADYLGIKKKVQPKKKRNSFPVKTLILKNLKLIWVGNLQKWSLNQWKN